MSAKSDREFLELGWIADWRKHFQAALNSSLIDEFMPFEPDDESLRDEYILHCPCCHKKVQVLEQDSLLELQLKIWLAHFTGATGFSRPNRSSTELNQNWMVYLKEQDTGFPWNHNRNRWPDWACDECLSGQLAEKAQFEQAFLLTDMHHWVTHWGYPSQYFYFDYKLVCTSCEKEFIYSKGQQRWFRESLVLYAESTLRECKACRIEKRQRNRIGHLIHLTKTDPDPFQYLEIVTDLMLRFSDPRALEYLRRAKNKAPTPQQRREFEEKIALLEEVK